MDEYQLEKAFETLLKLRRLDFLSTRTAELIDLIQQKLDLCQILFEVDDDAQESGESETIESELPWLMWRAAVEVVQLLIVQAEEETQSSPGCLPADPKGCELMSLAYSLRRAVMEGCEFYGVRLKKKNGGS